MGSQVQTLHRAPSGGRWRPAGGHFVAAGGRNPVGIPCAWSLRTATDVAAPGAWGPAAPHFLITNNQQPITHPIGTPHPNPLPAAGISACGLGSPLRGARGYTKARKPSRISRKPHASCRMRLLPAAHSSFVHSSLADSPGAAHRPAGSPHRPTVLPTALASRPPGTAGRGLTNRMVSAGRSSSTTANW